MSSIHAFKPRPSDRPSAPRSAEQSATIIIFPGVRYERTGEREPSLAAETTETAIR